MSRDDLLLMTLECAVPMWVEQLRALTPEQRMERLEAGKVVDLIAFKGDVLMYGGRGCARVFNALAEGLALLSFAPGGVRFAGRHWETKEVTV